MIHGNKVYLGMSNADTVVFLDIDTIIQKPLNLLWEGREEFDFLARQAGVIYKERWKQDIWEKNCNDFCADISSVFWNSGVMVFQHGSHKKIINDWTIAIKKYTSGEYEKPLEAETMAEQLGLSLSVGKSKLSICSLEYLEHFIMWQNQSLDEIFSAIVVHIGGENNMYNTNLLSYKKSYISGEKINVKRRN